MIGKNGMAIYEPISTVLESIKRREYAVLGEDTGYNIETRP